MNLRQLRYFCATFDTGSTTVAAQQCHVSQSVVSAAIAQLEQRFGCRLFERHARGVTPSTDGVRLYRQARALLADADRLVTSFQRSTDGPQRVRLHVHRTLSAGLVGALVQRWTSVMPELELMLVSDPDDANATLTAQECAPRTHPFKPLWPEQYMLLLPPSHPWRTREHISIGDLSGQPFIERVQCERSVSWHQQLAQAGVRPHTVASVDSEEWALELVASGLGMTVAPVGPQARRPGVIYRDDVAALRQAQRVIGIAPHQPDVANALHLLEPRAWPHAVSR